MTGTLPARETPAGWVVHAPAKVNLSLEVLPKRSDGYHGIRTLLCPVRAGDTVLLRPEQGSTGRIDLSVQDCLPQGLSPPVPSDGDNLVVRALRAVFEQCGVAPNCTVHLTKRTPSQAGLGGGSSDAAAALVAANHAWRLGMTTEELVSLAAKVGSDVPGLLFRHATRCEGRGEIVTPTHMPAGIPLVIAKPREGLSTAEVFRQCDPREDSQATDRVADLINVFRQGSLQQAGRLMANQLQPAASRLCAAMADLLELLRGLPLASRQMTGSGTACFGICYNLSQAVRAASWLKSRGAHWAVATCTN